MTALAASDSFAMVDAAHVAEVGPAAAILYARIAWRSERSGYWLATRKLLSEETGLTPAMLRTAVQVLRERGWLTSERAADDDPTQVWHPVYPGRRVKVNLAPPPAESTTTPLLDQHVPPAEVAISSLETVDTTATTSLPAPSRALAVVPPTPEPVREDVEALCTHLADRIEGNGSKRPTITKAWRDAARLMLDRDERELDKVHRAIDWCQADAFWRANIMSMPTLRRQYDKLRLAAQRERTGGTRRTNQLLDLGGRGEEALAALLADPPFPARPALGDGR